MGRGIQDLEFPVCGLAAVAGYAGIQIADARLMGSRAIRPSKAVTRESDSDTHSEILEIDEAACVRWSVGGHRGQNLRKQTIQKVSNVEVAKRKKRTRGSNKRGRGITISNETIPCRLLPQPKGEQVQSGCDGCDLWETLFFFFFFFLCPALLRQKRRTRTMRPVAKQVNSQRASARTHQNTR